MQERVIVTKILLRTVIIAGSFCRRLCQRWTPLDRRTSLNSSRLRRAWPLGHCLLLRYWGRLSWIRCSISLLSRIFVFFGSGVQNSENSLTAKNKKRFYLLALTCRSRQNLQKIYRHVVVCSFSLLFFPFFLSSFSLFSSFFRMYDLLRCRMVPDDPLVTNNIYGVLILVWYCTIKQISRRNSEIHRIYYS